MNLLVNYIVKYQNNYVSAKLFYKQIPILLEKGIETVKLFNSQIFQYTFDYDEWPTTHTDPNSYIRPYNSSLFRIRENYKNVFYEKNFVAIEDNMDENQQMDMTKIYKIRYSVNLLPTIGEYIRPENVETGQ